MDPQGAKRRKLLVLLLVLLLVFGVICLITGNAPVDLLVPALVFVFALVLNLCPAIPEWQSRLTPRLKPYLPAAPDRAPPAHF